MPIVSKLSDIWIVNAELELLVMEPRKEFTTMMILVIGDASLTYFLDRSWYETLMFSYMGRLILVGPAALTFVSTACVIRPTKPLEYRR